MKIPEQLFANIRDRLWTQGDQKGWLSLSDTQKSALYEQWIADEEVGGVLSRFLDKANIRVYLKDTVMKPYVRERTKEAKPILRAVGLTGDEVVAEDYIKPHGRLLFDRRVVCWGLAKDWKSVLLAAYERAYRNLGKPYAAVLLRSVGKMAQPSEQRMVEDLASRLGIEKVVWFD
jgi:hypothetical protein